MVWLAGKYHVFLLVKAFRQQIQVGAGSDAMACDAHAWGISVPRNGAQD